MTDRFPRTIVAEFQKNSRGKLSLWNLIVIQDEGPYFSRRYYDVEWSKKYGYLFHHSGSGGDRKVTVGGIYFVGGPVEIKIKETPCQLVDGNDHPPWRGKRTLTIRERNRTRRLRVLPKAFDLELGDLLDWLQQNAIEQDAVWCSDCRDNVRGDYLCEHIWWCDKAGWYSTETCSSCLDGRCTNSAEITYPNDFDDGPLWMWAGEPQLAAN